MVLETIGFSGGVASILYGPKWDAPAFQWPATSRVRTCRYQLPSASCWVTWLVVVSTTASGTVAGDALHSIE